jgi:hypothetical protein
MPTNDFASENSTALGSGNTLSNTLKQPGADSLSGSVTRASTKYDLTIDWLDASGSVIESESIASDVSSGTQTTFDKPARSPFATVKVADAGSGSGKVDLVAHFR